MLNRCPFIKSEYLSLQPTGSET
jgi:hypothetical protein